MFSIICGILKKKLTHKYREQVGGYQSEVVRGEEGEMGEGHQRVQTSSY